MMENKEYDEKKNTENESSTFMYGSKRLSDSIAFVGKLTT